MKTKAKLPFLFLFAGLLLAACLPLFEDDCYDEYDEEYCDTEYYAEEDDEYEDGEEDEYAQEEAYYATQEAAATQASSIHAPRPNLRIETVPEDADPVFQVFDQYIGVFGLHVYASKDIPAEKLIHAAGVMAQYLDNDEDGKPDDPNVLRTLQAKHATIYIFPRPDSAAEEEFIDSIEYLLDNELLAIQPLYGEEIIPNGAAQGEFDASLEEIIHIITNSGYAHAYPEIFGEEPGTAIAEAMDAARGGHHQTVPSSYPENAWFTYDDKTCDYACMISEYHYWALTSSMSGS